MSSPTRTVIVGAGNRGQIYASYALSHPDEMKVVAVVEVDEFRRRQTADAHSIPPEMCFERVEELLARPKVADAVINGTMDRQHLATTLPLLAAGYDVLLEKPIGVSEDEVRAVLASAIEHRRKVMICHVLRYAPFYAEIRRRVAAGVIGEIMNVQASESIAYDHMAAAFVRGKWNRVDKSSPMLLSKACHDLDVITWMKSGIAPKSVSSLGSLTYFRPGKAPAGSGTRCLADCRIEADCPYSARKNYCGTRKWGMYAFQDIEHLNPSLEQKLESLATDNPYGRCVWRCDNDAVDRQSVVIDFADGCTATLNMVGGASRPGRSIHLIGTLGEIQGIMEEGCFVVRRPTPDPVREYSEERVEIDVKDNSHGGGDFLLVEDFIRVLRGEPASISTTSLEDSVNGHLIGFAAERSRTERTTIDISD